MLPCYASDRFSDEELKEGVAVEDVDEDDEESLDALRQAYDQTISSASRYITSLSLNLSLVIGVGS